MLENKLLKKAFYYSGLLAFIGLVLLGIIQMKIAANNKPIQNKTELSSNAFIGKVIDREGIASIKPVLNDRWSVADANMRLETGDLVMTGTRGANAVKLYMINGVQFILGPGTLLEITSPTNAKLIRGEIEVFAPEKAIVKISGFKEASIDVTGTQVLRSQDNKLTTLTNIPAWLIGYKNDKSTEAMGSLLANVDGRNVPLIIGYHKVTIDIRDQIARTEVEESFINTTNSVLEGVFYFPLPQDASISGFAMWIGDEMVQAEIVEKQRAREIYETILRERRDPGLLEWTGGNIFKARVFPINYEKRIKITYTQVLPKIGNIYHYNYALQSEMLRLHPLKKLQIDVKVSSMEALAKVESPSHSCRVDRTKNAAHVEFDAAEYTPSQDFELDIETAPVQSNITLVNHKRGNDGYFMLLVNAPQETTSAQRRILPNSSPNNFIIMADTSGSMSGPQRDKQIAFIEALLSSLGAQDTFNLVTCDVTTQQAFNQPALNTAENRERALQFLEKRFAFGWSDLNKAFSLTMEIVDKQTQVIYVGDGVITRSNSDPITFSKQLKALYKGNGTFHAVATSSSYESTVLKAIASLGGGSVRFISGATDPSQTAFDLLKEISSPIVKDLKIKFTGLDVAAIYPDTLPNLPAGTQQFIVGRYNPATTDGKAQVLVSGLLNGQQIEYSQVVTLANENEGNSFIPRLWARHHLDHLLAEGTSQQTKDKIITLSEDFQIITPYTSFLVLESDADRERFNVKKRFHLRDGEEFFAAGRDNATFELTRQQMIKARRYRTELRAKILDSIVDLNRSITTQLTPQNQNTAFSLGGVGGIGSVSGRFNKGNYISSRSDSLEEFGQVGGNPISTLTKSGSNSYHSNGLEDSEVDDAKPLDIDGSDATNLEDVLPQTESDADLKNAKRPAPKTVEESKKDENTVIDARRVVDLPTNGRDFSNLSVLVPGVSGSPTSSPVIYDRLSSLNERLDGRLSGAKSASYYGYRGYSNNFDSLFPSLATPKTKDTKSEWPTEVIKILKTIDHRETIINSENNYQIKVESEYKDHRERITNTKSEFLLSKTDWASTSDYTTGNDFTIDWYTNNERGVLNVGWLLGRSRPAIKGDEDTWEEPFSWYFGDSLAPYLSYKPELKQIDANKVSILLHYPNSPDVSIMLIIDTTRSILLEYQYLSKNQISSKTIYTDFVEIGGAWWPQSIITQDGDGKTSSKTKIFVKALPKEQFSELLAKTLAVRKDAILLGEETEKIETAKQQVKDRQAQLVDYWKLLKYFADLQQWDKVDIQLQGIAELTKSKPGLNLLKLAIWQASRHNEEVKLLSIKLANELAKHPREADYSIANQILNYSSGLNLGNEKLEILNILKPVYERQKSIIEAMQQWDQAVVQALQTMNRPDEVLAKQAKMAQDYPFNYSVQTDYLNALASLGEIDTAVKYLEEIVVKNAPWQDYELQQLKSTGGQILINAYRLPEFVAYIENWKQQKIGGTIDQNVLSQYLSALIMLDQEAKASQLIKQWLVSARKEKLEPIEANKLGAAIQQALGQGYNLYSQRIDPQYIDILADTARYFASHLINNNYTGQILNYNFIRTDKGRVLQLEFYQKLQHEVKQMPVLQLYQYFSWLKPSYVNDIEGEKGWQKILDDVFVRWQQENNEKDKQILGSVIAIYGRSELKINYYRTIFSTANTPENRSSAAYSLFYALLGEKWSASVENELVQLLPYFDPKLGEDAASTKLHLDALIVGLHNFTSWLVQAKTTAIVTALPNVNLTTRRELKAATEKAQTEARTATLQLLTRLEKEFNPIELRPWITIERLYLEVKLKGDPTKIKLDTIVLLSSIPSNSTSKTTRDIFIRDHVLAVRAMTTLIYLAVQKNDPETTQQLLAIMDKAIAQDNQLLDWKAAKYQLLVALDRGNDVEAVLREWFGEKNEFAKIRWGRDYAYILAERNQISEAIKVFEQIEKEDELYFADYRTMADWYTVQNLPEKAHEAKIKSWQAVNENTIYNELNHELYKYQRQGTEIPSELDAEVPIKLVALLSKAQYPANYLSIVSNYYQITKDFRLLECVPEAMIGQSAQRIYPLLKQFSSVSNMIQEEATVDRLEKHLQSLYTKTKSSIDRRALRLLEFMVERHATEQANGIEPHAGASLRALKEAYKGELVDGEAELMAEFLYNQGALKPETLANEQLRQLSDLYSKTIEGSYARLVVGGHFAGGQWENNRREMAVITLGNCIAEYRRASGGRLPQTANSQLSTYCEYLETLNRYSDAESVWLKELKQSQNNQQIYWLKLELYKTYASAISNHGVVSLGTGETLYQTVHKAMLKELEEHTNENQATQYIQVLCDIWYNCDKDLHYASAKPDLISFAFETLPKILKTYNYRSGQSMVSSVSYKLHEIAGALPALEFLVGRAENEPSWLRLQSQDFWYQHSSSLSQYRAEANGQTPQLEKRLLAIVLKELRTDLQTRSSRNRNIYYVNNSYFWAEKKAEFSRTAQEVLAENAQSEETTLYVADYLYDGLKLYRDAIDVLLAAYNKNLLGIEGQYKLCTYLQDQKRYSESVPLLVKMTGVKPDRLEFRAMLMRGYFYTDRKDLLGITLTEADKYFHLEGRWQENVIATLGSVCLETELYRESIAYYQEAIALHVKTAPNRGIGDGVLSQYYRNSSGAYSGLGMTKEAVDAAAGAIISWGPTHQNRQYELSQLESVLRNAKDLDDYVDKLNIEVDKSGLENPIVRKALGTIYFEKKQLQKAETQLILAIQAQPNDIESQQLLIEVYDKQGNARKAIEQLLAFSKLTSHDLNLYQQLGKRWTEDQKPEEAERAYTNMVEVMPNESESHEALAKVRREQNRWEDALVEWQEVIRVRTKEPTGYIGLAETLIHLKRWNEARKVIAELSTTDWPKHFGDIKARANALNSQIHTP